MKLSSALKNRDGKFSTSGICGVLCVTIGLLCYIAGVIAIFKGINNADSLLIQSLAMTTLGTSMVITKKLKSSLGTFLESTNDISTT